jgi:excinuclease ABC subunit C
MENKQQLKKRVRNLPALPGIYQFFDKNNKIIYIGKAKNLKNRVSSYFNNSVSSPKTLALVNKISDLQIIATNSEVEALVLENNLIKEFKPRYNINLKDDKTFPFIKVTNEPYPRIFATRTIDKDGAKYFGPFTDIKSMRASLSLINRIFRVRSCKYFIDQKTIDDKKIKVCLDYHIKKCDGPCEGLISSEAYNRIIANVIKLLKGKTTELISDLTNEMNIESSNMNFEKAAEIRDSIRQLYVYSQKQKVVSTDPVNRDIIAFESEGKDIACSILNVRSGVLLGKRQFHFISEIEQTDNEIYSSIINKYYDEFADIPDEIILERELEEIDIYEKWFLEKHNAKVKFIVPKKESLSKSLLSMSKQNAKLQLNDILLQKEKSQGNLPHVLSALKRDLRLNKLPRRIECFDISHLLGTDTVASMVVFKDGKPAKSLYRKFNIKDVEGVDDFESMREVITRRFSQSLSLKEDFPDLIIIDGGKGQLSAAMESLNKLNLKNLSIISLAKKLEEIFMPDNPEPQNIPRTSSSLKLIQHLRDEAHRFAITFHRSKRNKRTFQSELNSIKGIGEKLATKLLQNFGSVSNIKKESVQNLAKVIGIAKANLVFDYFQTNKNN